MADLHETLAVDAGYSLDCKVRLALSGEDITLYGLVKSIHSGIEDIPCLCDESLVEFLV